MEINTHDADVLRSGNNMKLVEIVVAVPYAKIFSSNYFVYDIRK